MDQENKLMRLDVKDKKILFELSLNARASFSEIAKKVGLSKQVVKYRLESLEKKKVIEGYYAILNTNKLGFLFYRIAFKFQNVNPEKENELVDYFKNHDRVGWISQTDGAFDLMIAIWAQNVLEFEEVLDKILHDFGTFFSSYEVSVATRIYHFKQRFLLSKNDNSEFIIGGASKEDVDDLDKKILRILSKDARKNLLEIGAELKINPKVINYRIKKMIHKKIILGFNVKLNHRILGYTHQKVFLYLTNISKERISKLLAYLKQLKSLIYITKAIGMAELEFEVMVKNNEELHDLLRELRYNFSDLIKSHQSIIFFHEPYINYLPMEK